MASLCRRPGNPIILGPFLRFLGLSAERGWSALGSPLRHGATGARIVLVQTGIWRVGRSPAAAFAGQSRRSARCSSTRWWWWTPLLWAAGRLLSAPGRAFCASSESSLEELRAWLSGALRPAAGGLRIGFGGEKLFWRPAVPPPAQFGVGRGLWEAMRRNPGNSWT